MEHVEHDPNHLPRHLLHYPKPTKILKFEKIKLTKPQLILIPSLARSPVAPVRFKRSDPARSTKWNLAVRSSSSVAGATFPLTERFTAFSA